MSLADKMLADKYEPFYREFDSPLMRHLRVEAYGEDIGQHSWVGAEELRADAARLGLNSSSRLLDLGSGPCGPLTFLISLSGCIGLGLELSPSAIALGYTRATALGIQNSFSARVADLNDPIDLQPGSFDVATAIDVILHLRDREALFRQVAKLLVPGGTFLFTDAGVITGAVTNDEVLQRSVHGYTQFVPEGWNETLLGRTGFKLLETENRTASVFRNASGRLTALQNHRDELQRLSGVSSFESQYQYLTVVQDLAHRNAVSRIMYLAEA